MDCEQPFIRQHLAAIGQVAMDAGRFRQLAGRLVYQRRRSRGREHFICQSRHLALARRLDPIDRIFRLIKAKPRK